MADDDELIISSALEGPRGEELYVVETVDPRRPAMKIRLRVGWLEENGLDLFLLRLTEVNLSTGGRDAISTIEVLCDPHWWQDLLDAVMDHVINVTREGRGVPLDEHLRLGYGWLVETGQLPIVHDRSADESDEDVVSRPRTEFEVLTDELDRELRDRAWDLGIGSDIDEEGEDV